MNNILDALHWRYATKQFDPEKKLSPAQLDLLLEALRLSPSSFGLQPWKFVVVSNPKVRAKLREEASGQLQLTEASHLIVFTVKRDINDAIVDEFIQAVAQARGVDVTILKGYANFMKSSFKEKTPEMLREWAARQAYIALGTLLTAAAVERIDACPMEGFDPKKFDEILGLKKQGFASVVIVAVGFRSAQDRTAQTVKMRFPKNQVIVEVK